MVKNTLGATHGRHRSPHLSSAVQSVVTLVLTLAFYLATSDGGDPLRGAHVYQFGLLAILGTMWIPIVA